MLGLLQAGGVEQPGVVLLAEMGTGVLMLLAAPCDEDPTGSVLEFSPCGAELTGDTAEVAVQKLRNCPNLSCR